MSFSSLIPDGFPDLYDDEWKLEFQQLTARLAPFVDVHTIKAGGKMFRRIPKSNARKITTRFGKTNPDDVPTEYRWLYPAFSDCAAVLDRREGILLGEVGSPHEDILKSQLAAAARDRDLVLVDGIRGDVQSGKTGGTILSFASECETIPVNYVPSGSPENSGMTFDKLLRVCTLFGLKSVSGQDVEENYNGCLVVTHNQIQDLLREEKLTSADYGFQRLMAGEVVGFNGLAIKAVDPDILPHNAGTDVRSCYAFVRPAVGFGVAEEPTAFVDILPEQRHDIQLRTEWGFGCTRRDPDGVIEILCDESPA